MAAGRTGMIFDIKHYAIHDGPGIRTTVFLKGCPLRCSWCANPESQSASVELLYNRELCSLCLRCLQACPSRAISQVNGELAHNRSKCDACGECARVCPSGAVELCGRRVGVEELWQKIKADRAFWDNSGGGVTLSGGEPLLQPEFTKTFLALCRKHRVQTAVETCGFGPASHFSELIELVDLVIFDIKSADSAVHRRYTGASNNEITANLIKLLNSTQEALLRMPLIPGCNDSPRDLQILGSFLENLRPGVSLEILPYHRLGAAKYGRLGRSYSLAEVEPPTPTRMDEVRSILSRFRLRLVTEDGQKKADLSRAAGQSGRISSPVCCGR